MIVAFWMTTVLASVTVPLPHDVEAFLDRRAQCEHWAGEDPYDGPRAREIESAVQRLRCDSLETDDSNTPSLQTKPIGHQSTGTITAVGIGRLRLPEQNKELCSDLILGKGCGRLGRAHHRIVVRHQPMHILASPFASIAFCLLQLFVKITQLR